MQPKADNTPVLRHEKTRCRHLAQKDEGFTKYIVQTCRNNKIRMKID